MEQGFQCAVGWLSLSLAVCCAPVCAQDQRALFDFEDGAANWGAQVNWADVPGVGVEQSADWAASGSHSIKGTVDLTKAATAYSMQIFQDVDLSAFSKLTAVVKHESAGNDVRAKLFVKYRDSWTWKDGGETPIGTEGTELSVPVDGFGTVKAIGIQFVGYDQTATAAKFYVDAVTGVVGTAGPAGIVTDEPTAQPDHCRAPLSVAGFATENVQLVDAHATPETASLFAYLRNISGKGILFGHQHETTQGLTITDPASGLQSDTFNAVGAFSAVYGWDTLSLDTKLQGAGEENIDAHVREAYRRGGIITISAHLDNFTSGGDAWDTTKSVEHILPGGKDHQQFTAYLNEMAAWLQSFTDEKGKPIPMILRLYHENTGSWFWWGAAHCSADEYKKLFRFTVEYLRDLKGLHNLLYAYSPNEDAAGNEAVYLERYPGDDYVDILAFDAYGQNPSAAWFAMIAKCAANVVRMSEARGKVAAISETGFSGKQLENHDAIKTWYTSLLNALKADEDAQKISYFLVWRNGRDDHAWVPFRSHPTLKGHSVMLDDFITFYNDPYMVFNDRLQGAYALKASVLPARPVAYLVSPTDLQKISGRYTLRAELSNAPDVKSATVTLDETHTVALTFDPTDGYYKGELDTTTLAEDTIYTGTLRVETATDKSLTDSAAFIVNNEPDVLDPAVVDTFELYYGRDDLLRAQYTTTGDASSVALDVSHAHSGKHGMRFNYTLASSGYTGVNHSMNKVDWSVFNALELWINPGDSKQRMVIQINANGAAWEAYCILGNRGEDVTTASVNKHGNETVIPELAEPSLLQIPFSEFIAADWSDSTEKTMNPSSVSQFSIYINGIGGETIDSGVLGVDEIKAIRLKSAQ